MKKYLPVLFLFFFLISLSGFTVVKKYRAAIYDNDSVITSMPEYRLMIDSCTAYLAQIDSALQRITNEYELRRLELANDSAKWSPLVRQIKQEDFERYGKRIDEFIAAANDEMDHFEAPKLARLNARIKVAAETEVLKGKFDVVLDKDEWTHYKPVKPVVNYTNVTRDMINLVNTGNR